MGAVLNIKPSLFKAALVEVPFVDVVNTMLDESLPLMVEEFEEWGNPKVKAEYQYMMSYSPYDNVISQAYPGIFVRSSYNDSQVLYPEPAKWVAKLRALKTDRNPLLLRMEMDPAGHGGRSGLERDTINYSFKALTRDDGTDNADILARKAKTMTLIPFALIILIIAAACFGMLIAEDQLSMEIPSLFPHRAAKLRGKVGPTGYMFLRNYKRIHQDRIERAVRQMHLGEAVSIQDQAFSSKGDRLPAKIAIYACNNQAADHFFHGYVIVKARDKMMPASSRTCPSLSQAYVHPLVS